MSVADELGLGSRLKIERAKHHIDYLEGQIDSFMSQKPFKLMAHCDPKADKLRIKAETNIPIPQEFSLIIGDAVHNLRSALDLVMFGFAGEKTPSTHTHKIQFPFPREAKKLEEAIDRAQVNYAGKKVVEAVTALKPYPGGNETLSGLHLLDVQDKHRLLILSRRIATIGGDELGKILGIQVTGPGKIVFDGPEDSTLFSGKGGFGNRRRRLALMRTRGTWSEEARGQATFYLAFGKGLAFEGGAVIPTLRICVEEIERTVSTLVEAFLHKDNSSP